jgi:hypothetical protein
MNITRGKKNAAMKIGLYGAEGVGKTTFASQAPGCVFIDTEGSTTHMDVARTDPPKTWNELTDQVKWFTEHPETIGTLVIDTMDWAEKLAIQDVCLEKKLNSIEELPYGKGYVFVKDRIVKLLEDLDKLISVGVNVILTAHAQVKKFEQPDEMGSYDRYMLKLNEKNVSPLIKEWCDLLLFANFKTDVVTDADGKTKKGRGGQKRVMYTQHSACWDAKNRFGLDDPLPFDFAQIAHLFTECPPVEAMTEEPTPKQEEKPKEVWVQREPVTVTTGEMVPEPGKKKGKTNTAEPPEERPESMKSDDTDKDQLLAKLWDTMLAAKVYDPLIVQSVVSEKDYYDITVPIRDYDADFIEGCLIEAWDQVNSLCQTKIHDLPF